ncbi:Hypothetical predicted protein [Lecanosticta acicola]|uniref:Rhamnogalacturonase A/B/Epimerase-like pectate lyase domain-containing protein n=1 Tax=Lecanosticta acicola TaxID=111012 RepID=A0AAI8YRZ7_9PEZI|nr:Hypothetical predicted protein [Lecanosticta acicola]
MFSTRSITLLTTALSAILTSAPGAQAVPASSLSLKSRQTSSGYWLPLMQHDRDTVWMGESNATVFYDVTKHGVDNSGASDISGPLNDILNTGCNWGCNSSTVQPMILYFPAGTYLVSKQINMSYYSQFIGDPTNRPVIKASADFTGMAVLDADPYWQVGPNAVSSWINQNNFFRQVRNFVMDFTASADGVAGIHWQVAQATSIQNVDFKMKPDSKQQGIFMDNGSGGFFSDLTFEGGLVGAFLGSQQFTSRNLKFTNCKTAIFMNWNWGWTLSNVSITGGDVGIDMSNSPSNMTVGSMILADSTIDGSTYGIKTAFGGNGTGSAVPAQGGTLYINNVDMSTVTTAAVFQNATQEVLLKPGKITSWAQGNGYDKSATAIKADGVVTGAPVKASSLLGPDGKIFGRSKPQYEDVPASNFLSAKVKGGCAGDGQTDDTKCINDFLALVANTLNAIAYFDHGAYLVKDTIKVPNKIKIVGCIWPLIVADSACFSDINNPRAVFQVGDPTSASGGAVEISDMLFTTNGPAPGAIMVEWNVDSEQGDSGMWDTHMRIGGAKGTNLQEHQCPGWPTSQPSKKCEGVFLMFHATKSASNVYLENDWFWVADHDLDTQNQTQVSIYSARGVLMNNKGAAWLWGTASEHSAMYNYQLDGVEAFFGGFMQSETPYYQPSPEAPQPFTPNPKWDDPEFTICQNATSSSGVPCKDAWGLRIVNSKGVLIYATGMYSFFQNYAQTCVPNESCQENMIRIQNSEVAMFTVTTKASINMIVDDALDNAPVLAQDNRDVYGDTLAYYFSQQHS